MISFELGAQVSVILNAYDGLAGQRILMAVSLYVLPVWVLLLLLASGAVSLPFSVPFLDDLLSWSSGPVALSGDFSLFKTD